MKSEQNSGSEGDRELHLSRPEILAAIFCHLSRGVLFAAEYVDEGPIGIFGKVTRDQ